MPKVALLAEGVDRNARVGLLVQIHDVALLAEGVDRNIVSAASCSDVKSRPPRGGRG